MAISVVSSPHYVADVVEVTPPDIFDLLGLRRSCIAWLLPPNTCEPVQHVRNVFVSNVRLRIKGRVPYQPFNFCTPATHLYGIRVIAQGREDVYLCTVESMEVIWDSSD